MTTATEAGFLHPFTGLDHLLVMVAVGLWAVQLRDRALWLLPFSFVTSMLVGGMIGFSGMHLPFLEQGIVASIMLFGVALGLAWKPSLRTASMLVGAAGLLHGIAHGCEISPGDSPLLFLGGMLAATSLLHGLGVGGGIFLGRNRFFTATRFAGGLLLAFAFYDVCFPL